MAINLTTLSKVVTDVANDDGGGGEESQGNIATHTQTHRVHDIAPFYLHTISQKVREEEEEEKCFILAELWHINFFVFEKQEQTARPESATTVFRYKLN